MGVTKPFPASVPLSSRAYIDRMDAGLTSVAGAQEIISMISSRRVVTKLILGHNELSDNGCIVLFKFLGSAIGRKYQITEISLNSNSIGNRGLLAISDYLKGNTILKELFLQDNNFSEDPQVFTTFTRALNASHLEVLSLTTNRNLSDPFAETFLPLLEAPHLRELHLSAIDLTPQSGSPLVAYISSPRCRLHTLKCNGNSLGFRAVKSIIRAIERHNFSLLTVELHANHLVGPVSSDNTSEEDGDEDMSGPASPDAWKASETQIRRVLFRNSHLKRETEKEAIRLFRYARPLLLCSSKHANAPAPSTTTRCTDCSCSEIPSPNAPERGPDTPASNSPPVEGIFPFHALPTELQLYTLSFLAPSLSPAQRSRIYNFASSPSTLPRLGLCLPSLSSNSRTCVLDPASMPFGFNANTMSPGGGCAGGKCAGSKNSVLCHKEKQRGDWLAVVGCSAYDPYREGEVGEAGILPATDGAV
ncbi:RNI-like protein [Favolaschia claudopus]|uniref:RNI-like protein n=1 Tax=Favolaschia claudopus TaxID=2862362 RepID=A0AAW0DLQ3_9AGAR